MNRNKTQKILFIIVHCLWILAVIGFIVIFILTVKESNEQRKHELTEKYEEGYLDACKDFYKGKTKYDLVKNDDGTVIWKNVE
jgi:uncharacterized protein YpmB